MLNQVIIYLHKKNLLGFELQVDFMTARSVVVPVFTFADAPILLNLHQSEVNTE